jgi:hypothetical protein
MVYDMRVVITDRPGHEFGAIVPVPFDQEDLGDLVFPGEATEVLILDVLERVDPAELDRSLDRWLSLVGSGGTVIIGGTDLLQVCEAVSTGKLNELEAADFLYKGRLGCFSAPQIVGVLESRGFHIERVVVENLRYSVAARKS